MREKPLHSTRVGRRNRVSICAMILLLALPSAHLLAEPNELTLATWNIRWLNQAQYAPDSSQEGQRSQADFAKLAQYARALDADLVALQEVGDPASVARIFPPAQYQFWWVEQGGRQRVALVARHDLKLERLADYRELANSGGRAGLDLRLKLGQHSLRLLLVHLKSGCHHDGLESLSAQRYACARFKLDLAYLERWIDLRAQAGEPFLILGDFNRQLAGPDDRAWQELDDDDPPNLRLVRIPQSTPQRACPIRRWNRHAKRWQPELGFFRAPISHHIAGGKAIGWVAAPAQLLRYTEADALRYNLSDHCPLSFVLRPPGDQHTLFLRH